MKHKLFTSLLFGACLTIFTGCRADVDLNDIDTTVNAKFGLALPIGTMSMTIGDWLGNGSLNNFIKPDPDGSGTLCFLDTFSLERKFADLSYLTNQVVGTAQMDLNLDLPELDIPALSVLPPGAPSMIDTTIVLPPYEQVLDFSDIYGDISSEDCRIDSITVRHAEFVSVFKLVGTNAIPFKSIKNVKVVLSPEHVINQNDRNNPVIIKPDLSNKGYGKEIPISLNDITLSLLDDPKKPVGPNNVTKSVKMDIYLEVDLSIDPLKGFKIDKGAYVDYSIQVKFLEFDAIWGIFDPHNELRDEAVISINDEIPGWNDFSALRLPLAKPSIDLQISHSVAGPLMFHGDYLKAISKDDEEAYVTFDEAKTQRSKDFQFDNILSPIAPIEEMVANHFPFNESDTAGNIDTLFSIFPDRLAYKFDLRLDEKYFNPTSGTYEYKVGDNPEVFRNYRLSKNTMVGLDAFIKIPLAFNEGFNLSHQGTEPIPKELNEQNIDSMLNEYYIDSLSANLFLTVDAYNGLPFGVNVELDFLDENNDTVDLVLVSTQDKDGATNILNIPGPKQGDVDANGVVIPGKEPISQFIFQVSADQFDKLPKLKKVAYNVSMGGNEGYVCVSTASYLKMRLSLAANVDVTADLGEIWEGLTEKDEEDPL